jgi:hypothetical protein
MAGDRRKEHMMRHQGVTRRAVFKAGSGLAVAALHLSGASTGSGRFVSAQDASPSASPSPGGLEGRYVAVRIRTLKEVGETAEVFATIEEGFIPLVEAVPGFIAYLGIADPSSDQTAFVNVFADKAGADESTRVGGAWLQENEYDFFAGEPTVVEGTIGVAAGSLSGDAAASGYAVIRSRTLNPDRSGVALLDLIRDGFVPLLESAPGFVAYLAASNEETRGHVSLGVFATEEAANESTRLAEEWGARSAAEFTEGDPLVITGPITLATASGET